MGTPLFTRAMRTLCFRMAYLGGATPPLRSLSTSIIADQHIITYADSVNSQVSGSCWPSWVRTHSSPVGANILYFTPDVHRSQLESSARRNVAVNSSARTERWLRLRYINQFRPSYMNISLHNDVRLHRNKRTAMTNSSEILSSKLWFTTHDEWTCSIRFLRPNTLSICSIYGSVIARPGQAGWAGPGSPYIVDRRFCVCFALSD